MNKKLFVFGCSYSDYTGVTKTYGDYLSELTGLEYHHCAKGGTSNDRIWRMATRKILDGEITANDIVIVQYTDRHRREFASYGLGYNNHLAVIEADKNKDKIIKGVHPQDKTSTECGTFYTSNYKCDSHNWQLNDIDKQAHFAYQHATGVDQFDNEYFKTRHRQFEAFCEINHINLVIYWCRLSTTMTDYQILDSYARKYLIEEENILPTDAPHCYKYELGTMHNPTVWDSSHINDLGHRTVAEHLSKHLSRHMLI